MDDEFRARRGLVPWSVVEYQWIMQAFMSRRKNIKGNLPITAEFAHLKSEAAHMTGGELYNFNSMLLMSKIFHERYPEELEYNAHFFRFHEIKDFMHEYGDELSELGFIPSPDDIMNVNPKLLESLCVLLFSLEGTYEDGDPYFTFSFDEVVAATEAKLGGPLKSVVSKKEPKNKADNEDKAFRGMIPWSLEEFNWVIAESQKNKNPKNIEKKYSDFKENMEQFLGRPFQNFNNITLIGEIIHKKYPKIEYMAHFYRFHQITSFLDKYKNELEKEGFMDTNDDNALGFKPQLMDILCTLPYSSKVPDKSGDSGQTFSYPEVVAKTKAKLNAHLN